MEKSHAVCAGHAWHTMNEEAFVIASVDARRLASHDDVDKVGCGACHCCSGKLGWSEVAYERQKREFA